MYRKIITLGMCIILTGCASQLPERNRKYSPEYNPYDRNNTLEADEEYARAIKDNESKFSVYYKNYEISQADTKIIREAVLNLEKYPAANLHFIKIDNPIDGKVMDKAFEKNERIQKNLNKGDRVILVFNSPGGNVNARSPEGEMIDTYISKLARSQAAYLFLKGKNRLMKRGAKIMFHGVSQEMFPGGEVMLMTCEDWQSILETKDLPKTSKNINLQARAKLKKNGKWNETLEYWNSSLVPGDVALSLTRASAKVTMCKMHDNEIIALLSKVTGKPEDFVKNHVLKPNEDVYLTAEQALEYGIATHIID